MALCRPRFDETFIRYLLRCLKYKGTAISEPNCGTAWPMIEYFEISTVQAICYPSAYNTISILGPPHYDSHHSPPLKATSSGSARPLHAATSGSHWWLGAATSGCKWRALATIVLMYLTKADAKLYKTSPKSEPMTTKSSALLGSGSYRGGSRRLRPCVRASRTTKRGLE